MPKIEIKAKELNDVKIIKNMQKIKNTIENKSTTISDKSSQQCFVIEFNENGSPIDCHKFIRYPVIKEQLKIKFKLNEAFFPEESSVGIEILKEDEQVFKLNFEKDTYELEYCLKESGTFSFKLISGNKSYTEGIIQVAPNFLNPDNIKLITLVSKWMGPIENNWEKFFKVIESLDYNMIHFTPLQQRGISNSPYSIKDQLNFADDLFIIKKDEKEKTEEVESILKKMKNKFGIFGMTDIVWNHTACDSEWLVNHPEAGYNLENSPHLKSAFELDEKILEFSSNLKFYNLNGELNNENDLLKMMIIFKEIQLPKAKLWEYFVIDLNSAENQLIEAIEKKSKIKALQLKFDEDTNVKSLKEAEVNDGKFDRFSNGMELKKVISFYAEEIEIIQRNPSQSNQLLSLLLSKYRSQLDLLNVPKYQEYDRTIDEICKNIFNRVMYERITENGPKIGNISESLPLVPTYFTRVPKQEGVGVHALANNGWIWNNDPFNNFAESTSQAYLRREVIVWGDCVKLRYGSCYDDNPWLWDHMAEYTRQMAKLFHAFRIDNCHSTPIHVARYLLKEARKVRPDLYICAELFTGSEEKDMKFVSSLGINSLIREAMVAWDCREISRLTANYGGMPIGSFQLLPEYMSLENSEEIKCKNIQSHIKSYPHNIYFDCTHDNEPPAQKRTVFDTLSNSAIVSFSSCATGSTFGYDQLVPHHINIVEERRKYEIQIESKNLNEKDKEKIKKEHFIEIKRFLNSFHSKMIRENCTEISVKSFENRGIVMITRDDPENHCGYNLITRTAYNSDSFNEEDSISEILEFPGCDVKVEFSAFISKIKPFVKDKNFINGLEIEIESFYNSAPSNWFSSTHNLKRSTIEIISLPPGAILILKRNLFENTKMEHLNYLKNLNELKIKELRIFASKLNLIDLNFILYRCDEEEKDEFPGISGVYNVPGYGEMNYCGIEGTQSILSSVQKHNNLNHPLCENLRQGYWLLDYTVNRLERSENENIKSLVIWMKEVFYHLKGLPGYLRPKYTAKVFELISKVFTEQSLNLMSLNTKTCGELIRKLAMGSVQMIGKVPSSGLTPKKFNEGILKELSDSPTLCAGLPHFATHHMRCWGRDVFISFRGLLLITGRFDVARAHLLAFGSCVYRGMIPNLLDSGRRPRYNARDATWWFMQALQDYCKYSPEGIDILNIDVPLRFPSEEYIDFDDERIYSTSMKMKKIVQMIMNCHAQGIHFREWNAGPALDSVMRFEGFQIDIEVDWRTGFIFGGNQWNCGTWMDKMGESELAGNRGIPTTPRDGAAIEITALLKSSLDWLASLREEFEFSGVQIKREQEKYVTTIITFSEWSELIQKSFEEEYLIETVSELLSLDSKNYYYKDTVGGCKDSDSLQMRPNYILAMAISPGLFNLKHARAGLALAEKYLTGPLGIKTLTPTDFSYRPNYENSLDCLDPSIARGANYHQGPEWLWCMGYYLRAWLNFNTENDSKSVHKLILTRLQPHRYFLNNNPGAGLPELTNENGSTCKDSCWTQAWSMACILEVVILCINEKRF